MADTFGGVSLPVGITDPPGDPGLGKLGAYLAAVINDQCGAAWAATNTAPTVTNYTRATPAVTDPEWLAPENPQPAVREVLTHDPERFAFNDASLPALFLWRTEDKITQPTEQFLWDDSKITALWVFTAEPQEKQRTRTTIASSIGKAVAESLWLGRTPAWFDTGDTDPVSATITASANSFVLSTAVNTSALTISGAGLNGALGGSVLSPRRIVTLTTSGGTWSVVAPIVVTYVNWYGLTATRNIQPTIAAGGQTLRLGEDIKQLVSVAIPAQPAGAKTVTVGNAARAGRGSELLTRSGFERVQVDSWRLVPLKVDVLDGEQRADERLPYFAVQMVLNAREWRTLDASTRRSPQQRLDSTYLVGGTFVTGQSTFPDHS